MSERYQERLRIRDVTDPRFVKDVVELGPGKSFWIGFFIDDNDHPFTDVQELIAWPATFGMFSPKEEGAVAVCE